MDSVNDEAALSHQVVTFHFGPGLLDNCAPQGFFVGGWLCENKSWVGVGEQHLLVYCKDPRFASDEESYSDSIGGVLFLGDKYVFDELRELAQ